MDGFKNIYRQASHKLLSVKHESASRCFKEGEAFSECCENHREITLTPLMINNQLSFNKFPRFDHMITQWNKKNKKTELLRTVRWEILSAAHKKCFIFSVSALPLHCGRVDNNVSVGWSRSALQRQYNMQ